MDGFLTPAERVIKERGIRDLSARAAADLAARELGETFTNTTWSTFESSGRVTPKVRRGVAAAFTWNDDWPENLPPLPEGYIVVSPTAEALQERDDALEARLDDLVVRLEALSKVVASQGAELARLRGRPAR